jgi:hypothetical protein
MRWWCARRGRTLPKVYRFYNLLNHAVTAKRRFRPRPYQGPVTLFRAEVQAQDRLFEIDATLGWGALCPDLTIFDLPGGHGASGKDEAVRGYFADAMDALLDGIPLD